MELIKVGKKEDIRLGGCKVVRHGLKKIAVFNINNNLYAIRDFCAHQGSQLSLGRVSGNKITCARHGWTYNFESGKCDDSDWACLTKYPIREENGEIFVEYS